MNILKTFGRFSKSGASATMLLFFVCSATAILLFPGVAKATISLNTTYVANAASSTMNGLAKQIRVDPATGKVYTLGTSTNTFLEFSADGSSVSAITYSSSLPSITNLDFVIYNSQLFINATFGTTGLYRYDITGSNANLVANLGWTSGVASIAFGPNSTIYANKGTALVPYDYSLVRTANTTTLSAAAIHMAYAGAKIYYISAAGRIASNDLAGSDVVISNSGAASARGLLVSSDASAIYFATSSAIIKILASGGTTLWSKPVSNVLAMDINTSTGKIYTVDGAGAVKVFYPINAPSSVVASASGSDVTLNWVSGADTDFKGVTIVRSTTGFPTSVTDGTMVTTTDVGSSFVDSGLDNATYYYSLFNQTLDGYYSAGATSSVTVANPPDAPVLSAVLSSPSSVALSWTSPARAAMYLLRRSFFSPVTSITDGSTITTTAYTNLVNSDLPDGDYYFGVFARDVGGLYSSVGAAGPITIDTTAPTAPSDFLATPSGNTITLDWNNPLDADFNYVTIKRSTDTYPATPSSGDLVVTTAATRYVETGLADGHYYYSMFAYDVTGNYSVATQATATVDTTAPVITLLGSANDSIVQGTTYTDPGATATDAIDGTITNSIVHSGSVNTAVPGTYTITYSVTDAAGNSASASRTVTVTSGVVSSGGGTFVAPTATGGSNGSTPLSFLIANGTKITTSTVTLVLNANPATVRGYAVSLDPTFKNDSIIPFTDKTKNAQFVLPNKPGTYKVYLKYYSVTGHTSDVMTQTVTYGGAVSNTSGANATANVAGQPTVFSRSLQVGTIGDDVKMLQLFLNTHGFVVAQKGPGSPGNETTIFGAATARAVAKFQEANAKQVLQPSGFKKGTGVFGPATVKLANSILK